MLVGYAKVNTVEKHLEIQHRQLMDADCDKVFREEVAWSTLDRPELRDAINYCKQGDVLLITKLDRIARSSADLLSIVKKLNAKGVGLRCIEPGGLDTTVNTDATLAWLHMMAEFEQGVRQAKLQESTGKSRAKSLRLARNAGANDEAEETDLATAG